MSETMAQKKINVILLILWATALPLVKLQPDDGEKPEQIGTQHDQHEVDDPSYRYIYPLAKSPLDYSHCKRPAKCVKVRDVSCMGVAVPYETSFDLIPGASASDYVLIKEKMSVLQGLEHIPKCWAIVRPFLCSVFMPKCSNDTVDLPSQEMCRKVSSACRVALNSTIWPSFIRCENDKLFPRQCKNDIREMKFNSTGRCFSPLVPSDNTLAAFEGIEGCGVPCSDPLYTEEEKSRIHSVIAWGASLCFLANFFTVLTFFINWRGSNKYPAVTVFYMNFCFMVSCLGWLMQFVKGRESIVCRKDGTLRMSEPNGEDLWCVVVFVMIYYSTMAAMIWLVIFSVTWFMTTKATTNIQGKIGKSAAYFHLLAWCLPLMFTVSSMAVDAIDGNYVTGICFVGYDSIGTRAFFVLGPVLVTLLIVTYFFVRGLIKLITLRKDSDEMTLKYNSSQIQSNIKKIGFFFAFVLITAGMTFYSHHYEYSNLGEWKQSFRNFIMCSILSKYGDSSECKLEHRPRSAKLQLHLLVFFVFGTLASYWVFTTTSTIHTWTRFFKWLIYGEDEDPPVKMTRHKMISEAYAKRKEFDNTGRLSFNIHEDPVGLNLDCNSEASQDVSSTFAAALLSRLVNRRGAMVDRSDSVSSRRSSEDSQVSISLRRVALGSRRNSGDSQIALSISELKADFKANPVKTRRKKKKLGRKSAKRLSAREDVESSISSVNFDLQRMRLTATDRSVESSNAEMHRMMLAASDLNIESSNMDLHRMMLSAADLYVEPSNAEVHKMMMAASDLNVEPSNAEVHRMMLAASDFNAESRNMDVQKMLATSDLNVEPKKSTDGQNDMTKAMEIMALEKSIIEIIGSRSKEARSS